MAAIMGDMLTKPEKQKFSSVFETSNFCVASSCMQGWRKSMEDAHIAYVNFMNKRSSALFGVFDGHQSDEAARYCRTSFVEEIENALRSGEADRRRSVAATTGATAAEHDGADASATDGTSIPQGDDRSFYRTLFENVFHVVDDRICQRYLSSGTTANIVLVHNNLIVCANAGDSRAVLCRGGKAVALSVDHHPESPLEKERIEQAGGHVQNGRVNMSLAVSRALGDVDFKQSSGLSWKEQVVTACPDVTVTPLQQDDQFIVMGCDGIWDILSNEQCCSLVSDLLKAHSASVAVNHMSADISLVCEQILDHCLADTNTVREGTDNMTIIIILLKKPLLSGAAVQARDVHNMPAH